MLHLPIVTVAVGPQSYIVAFIISLPFRLQTLTTFFCIFQLYNVVFRCGVSLRESLVIKHLTTSYVAFDVDINHPRFLRHKSAHILRIPPDIGDGF